MSRALTAAETNDLLSRNFTLGLRVNAHKALVAAGLWRQVEDTDALVILEDLPIPRGGYAIKDDKLGNVVIFPGAAGELHYTTDIPDAVVIQVNKPPYNSPSGNSLENIFADLQAVGGKLLKNAVLVAVVLGVAWIAAEAWTRK